MKLYYTKVIMKKADGSETEYICPVEKDGYYVDTRQLPNFLQGDEIIYERDGIGRFTVEKNDQKRRIRNERDGRISS